jgi:hypothetical protein
MLCSVLGILGCGARAEVAKDKVLAQVDALLGEIDVKRKEAEIGIRDMDTGLDQLKKGKIEAREALKQNLEEIDAKAVALKSIKDVSTLAGGGATFDFEKVEKQVKDLSTKIDTELAFHDEKAKEASTASDLKSIDSVIRQTSTAGDAVSEIDKILGKK